ncbi:MBL fold metallo-hydrolase [Bradyrhizobium sp. Ash2021]|uniref:MBL fold metallo-hydrolase n=1 Tax=Bradyrhizobium sp. Ash2021 TaxID=2954771 RepID=UPI00281631E5|nr:MBL fold metallo-hydrolase [Bradyrhizobium sp. Ash2021]WMT79691.1 MBL fold metallo-hydrolase [Bradyrhizobium sp. Ash2021]
MKRDWLLALVVVAGISTSQAAVAQTAPLDLIKQAVSAVGGTDALRNLKRISIKANAEHREPEQSYVADGEPRLTATSKLTISWDLESALARTEWDRSLVYPFPGPEKYSDVLTAKSGFTATEKGERPMSSIRVAAERRELERASPTLLLKALAAPERLGVLKDQPFGADSLPAVTFDEGWTKFIILFDRQTHLPAAIRTIDDDNLLGDAIYDVVFTDWKPVAGVQIAHTQTQRLAGVDVGKIVYTEVAPNPTLAAQTFEPSEAVRKDLKPAATANVPYQWVLRRITLARFIDSDAINYDAASVPGLKLVEITPNVQQVLGGSHNSLIVATHDSLVVFDAPINEWQSHWTIAAAKKKYPGKPVKYLFLTHQHNDHTGGVRTYVAEGATVIVGSPNKAYFEKVLAAPHTVNPDDLQKNPKPGSIIEVADQMTLGKGDDEIRFYRIANPHAEGMMIGYAVHDNVVWVTDLYSPTRDKAKSQGVIAFGQALKKYNIKPFMIAGGHGAMAPPAELEGIMSKN